MSFTIAQTTVQWLSASYNDSYLCILVCFFKVYSSISFRYIGMQHSMVKSCCVTILCNLFSNYIYLLFSISFHIQNYTWFRPLYSGSDHFTIVQTTLQWFKPLYSGSDHSTMVQTTLQWFRPLYNGSDHFTMVKTTLQWFRLLYSTVVQTTLQWFRPLWNHGSDYSAIMVQTTLK